MPNKRTEDSWHAGLTKMLWFLDDAVQHTKEQSKRTQTTLMEIVSASSLGNASVDPYCVVYINDQQFHRTKTIQNDPDPIWTVSTHSLCLLPIPIEDDEAMMKIEVNHGFQCLGVVTIKCSDILKKHGAREEFLIRQTSIAVSDDEMDDTLFGKPVLALRFRKASPEDIKFFHPTESSPTMKNDQTSDINFHNVNTKSSMARHTKIDKKDKRKRVRVQPYPNPDDVENTTWMTREELHTAAMEPSMNWVEAGYGDLGMVYIEVIGCENLPNMDVGVSNRTDAFVAFVFEDTMVRTDVVFDSVSPRWLPWSSRAFAFRVCHPSSIIMLGVFDYDNVPIINHDPIGRVVINTVNFKNNTTYHLHYKLHDELQHQDDRGIIRLRLRVEWKTEAEAIRTAFTKPPRFLINVESQKSLTLLRYICRGTVNMDVASVDSVKFYAKELMSYGPLFCYVLDVCLNIWLWRGRAQFVIPVLHKKVSMWFPLHSIFVFLAAILFIEVPSMIPTIFLYSIAWILLSMNYYGAKHPNPWMRCKTWHETNMVVATGKSGHAPVFIHENEGAKETAVLEALDKTKAKRIERSIIDAITVALKIRRIYKKTYIEGIAIETEDTHWTLLGDHLYHLHMALRMLCMYLRLGRNFVNWRGYSTHYFTMTCVIAGTMWLVLPMNYLLLWVCRALIWACLGPWMKLLDIYYVHPYYRTKEELLHDPTFYGAELEGILASESIQAMGASVRLASEEAMKLKSMREHEFGKFSQLIPTLDTSRFPDIPLPESTAEPYLGNSSSNSSPMHGFVDLPRESQRWRYVAGQHLGGSMVHHLVKQGDETVERASKDDVALNFDRG